MKSRKNGNESDRSAIDLAIELTAASADLASQINKYGKSAGSDLSKDQAFSVSQAAQQIQAVLTELIGAIDPCVSRKTGGTTPIENREKCSVSVDASHVYCDVCDQPIPSGRVQAMPGVRTCVACAEKGESPTPAPAVFISDSDISRYQKKRARDLEDEASKGKALRAARKQAKRKRRKKKSVKKKTKRGK